MSATDGIAEIIEAREYYGKLLDAGLKPQEADCLIESGNLARMVFALPEQHPSDAREIEQAIHVIQNIILGRPMWRIINGDPEAKKPEGVLRL
jgi:hypothetical protein